MANHSQTRLFTTELVRLAAVGLFSAVEAGLAEAKQQVSAKLNRFRRIVVLRSIATVLGLMALIWFCIGATFALAEYIPLWGAMMALSGILALGSLVTFIARPERADPHGKSLASKLETETENG